MSHPQCCRSAHGAIEFDHGACLDWFLSNGTSVDATVGAHGSRLVHTAILCETLPCLAVLCRRKANLDAQDKLGETPMHRAAFLGKDGFVGLLISSGANPNIRDTRGFGRTPLHLAVEEMHVSCAALLVERGAIVDMKDVFFKKTPLDLARELGVEDKFPFLSTSIKQQ